MGASQSLATPPIGSVEVPNTQDHTSGSSTIRRCVSVSGPLLTQPFDDVSTLYEGFQRGLRLSRNDPCIGSRILITPGSKDVKAVYGEYAWRTYAEVYAEVEAVGSALLGLGVVAPSQDPKPMFLVGLFSKNRAEWVIAEQACNAYSFVTVPLYDTLGPEAIEFILHQSQLSVVFASKAEAALLVKVKTAHMDSMAALTTVIQFEDVSEAEVKAAAAAGITLRSYGDIVTHGKAHPLPVRPPTPADVHTFCYTSGTTGEPKGAMLTHGNAVAMIAGALGTGVQIGKEDIHLSYLPLAHVFERLVEGVCWTVGARCGFYQGNTLAIAEDMVALRPTIFPSVPRLLNRIYDKITTGAAKEGGAKAAIFKQAYAAKQYWLKYNYVKHSVWDPLVFDKIKAKVGLDRCHLVVTGSAPIAEHVMEFLRIVFGCPVLEGYGQTECYGAASITSVSDFASVGHVGGPIACNEIKLVSVPEMEYLVTDRFHGRVLGAEGSVVNPGLPCLGRGEICYRGANVFAGYYKQPEKTAEVVDADGWLHSGDIGLFTPEGNLKIIDRKKNIFKLSQGEYIAVEKVENAYQKSPFVSQIFVYGDSLQSCLVAVVVPDPDHAKTWAATAGVADASLASLVKNKDFIKAVEVDMTRSGKEGQLKGFEVARAIRLVAEPFTLENDLLTPTFKLKRNIAKQRFQELIDEMYADPAVGSVAGLVGLKQGASSANAKKVAAGGAGAE